MPVNALSSYSFCLAMIFLPSQNSNLHETSKYQMHPAKLANHNTIPVFWHGSVTVERSNCIVLSPCFGRQTEFGFVSGRAQEALAIVDEVGSTFSEMKIENETTYAFVLQLK